MLKPVVVMSVLLTSPAIAQPLGQAAALTRLLSAPEAQAAWFAPSFLGRTKLDVVRAQLGALRTQYGKFVRLETLQGRPLAVFERGTLIITAATLDAQGRLTAFGGVPGPPPAAARGVTAPGGRQQGTLLLRRLFESTPVDTRLFSPEFLAQMPERQLRELFASIRSQNGNLRAVKETTNGWRVEFERGALDVPAFQVNAQGLITTLRLAPVIKDSPPAPQ